MGASMMPDVKFYIGRRDTRWDVYPQREPEVAVAHDWHGFWLFSREGGFWFKAPGSYVLGQQTTKAEAEAFTSPAGVAR